MTEDEVQMHATHPSFSGASTAFRALAQALTAGTHDQNISARALEDVKSLFIGESEIRVFIDGTKNLGHQAASLELLRRLLDITLFRGEVVVLYADYGRALLGATAEKIGFLLQQTVGTSLESITFTHHRGARIRFVPYDRRRSLPPSARYGFSGGADDMGVNYAAELGVDWFLRLQPFLWDDMAGQKSDPYYESTRIEAADGRMFYLVDAWPPLRDLPLKSPIASRRPLGVDKILGGEAIATIERLGYAIWPIYGLHHFRSLTPTITFNLVSAALILSAWLGRSIALLSFCPLDNDLGQLPLLARLTRVLSDEDLLIDEIPDLDDPSQQSMVTTTLSAIPRPAKLEFVNPEKVGFDVTPCSISSNRAQVAMVQLGPVAPSIFEKTLCDAPLPPLIEGQSTANYLLNIGRPYLHVLRPEHVIKNAYVSGVVAPGQSDLVSHMNGIVQRIVHPYDSSMCGRETAAECLAQLILRMRDPLSDEAKYFASFSDWLARDEHDKLVLGLLALHLSLQADK